MCWFQDVNQELKTLLSDMGTLIRNSQLMVQQVDPGLPAANIDSRLVSLHQLLLSSGRISVWSNRAVRSILGQNGV